MHHAVIKDCFGRHFRLHTPTDPPIRVAVEPESFWDLVMTELFVRRLRGSEGDWRYLLSRYDSYSGMDQGTGKAQDITTEARISQLLIQGLFTLYPLAHLNTRKDIPLTIQAFTTIQAEKGLSYQLVPASLLLVSTPPKIKEFNNIEEANHFITSLKIDDDQLAMLVHDLDLHVANGAQDHAKLLSALSQAMVEKKAVVIVNQQSAAPPLKKNSDDNSDTRGYGNKSASLGPHEGGESSLVKNNTFKTQHEAVVDISNKINPVSTAENKEYGGMIYQNEDGTFGYTKPVEGTIDGVDPGGPSAVPKGKKPVAYYHTHGAYDPGYDSENFSGASGDIGYADYYKIDGYVATPGGDLKHYDHGTGSIQTIAKVKN